MTPEQEDKMLEDIATIKEKINCITDIKSSVFKNTIFRYVVKSITAVTVVLFGFYLRIK